jgi:hypothetical protein
MNRPAAILMALVFAASGAVAAPRTDTPMLTWEHVKRGTVIGPLTVTRMPKAKDEGETQAMDFTDAHGAAARLSLEPSFGNEVTAAIGAGRIDPDSDQDQVLVTNYTGGAHCCVHIQLLDHVGGAWRTVDVGTFDGEPFDTFPRDVDGDGVADIVHWDDRFAYAFAPYAGSWMPPRIFNVKNGKALDVSAEPRYRALFETDYRNARADCLKHMNAACAGLVADGVRLARAEEAWKIALANIDRKDDWGLPGCKVKADRKKGCPAEQQYAWSEFRTALTAFLTHAGYLPERP